ncbi:hypothetical protein GCM10023191_046170 [Actinoallomurus oryzae]|uniref:Uncharacterized protein n=1 Tax=Actinoallomurus oryzae TaxID=502180 RepID=A0ABP8Q8W8_9ACTN
MLVAFLLALTTQAVTSALTVVLLRTATSRWATSAARTLRERWDRQLRLWDLYLNGHLKGP